MPLCPFARVLQLIIAWFVLTGALAGHFSQPARGATSLDKPPTLPKIDYNACPFEGCTFRQWVVTKDVSLYSTWREPRRSLGRLRKGEKVLGLTGVHITWRPDRIAVTQDVPDYGFRRGAHIFAYMYLGEGAHDVWVKGRGLTVADLSFVKGLDCSERCAGRLVREGRKEWWVKVNTRRGRTGWVAEHTRPVSSLEWDSNFTCMDALAGPLPECVD